MQSDPVYWNLPLFGGMIGGMPDMQKGDTAIKSTATA